MFHVYLRPVTLGTYRINIGPNVIEPPPSFHYAEESPPSELPPLEPSQRDVSIPLLTLQGDPAVHRLLTFPFTLNI